MYGALYRNVLLPAYERVRGRKMAAALDELELTQWLPPDEIRNRQWQALQRMLRHAASESPFYRKAFTAAGITPEDIRSFDDFSRLPFLEKSHLQEHGDAIIADSYRGKPLICAHSGGSTGRPVTFRYHRDHYDRRMAAWARADRWAGWELGERQIAFILGVGSGVGRRPLRKLIKERIHWKTQRWLVLTSTRMTPETVRKYHRRMVRFHPRSMYGMAVATYAFALMLDQLRLQPPAMRGIILGGEKIFPYQKRKIAEVFGTPVFERYGCQEFCNIGEECDRHDGMHINADGLYVEVVGPDGKPVSPGTPGEIVVTSLDNFAMPFIRYRIGDMGVMADGNCSCGRGLPRIREVLGRTLDMIVTPEGVVCSGVMMPHFMKEFESVREFQFVQESLDALTLRLVPGTGFDGEMKRKLETELRRWIGPTMRLQIEESAELQRAASGKYRMVISNLKIEDVTRRLTGAT